MIAKIMKSASFANTVNYILDNKKDARLIDYKGVRIANNQSIYNSFNLQSQLNTRLTKFVGHIALNFSVEDKEKITDALMVKVAREYMQKMSIVDTQYMIGRHFDKSHPHIHICYNRVDNQGKTISDKNDRIRSSKICKELTIKYGLYYADGNRQKVKMHRLKETYKTKYEIFRTIGECLFMSSNWGDFLDYMKAEDIKIDFKKKKNSNEIQGIIFTKNGFSFSGSKIAKKYSYSKLDKILSPQNRLEISKPQEMDTSILKNEKAIKIDLSILDSIPAYLYNSDEESGCGKKRKLRR